MSKKSLLKGTIIISIAGLIARFIGLFFRIPLTAMIGEEGMGIYSFPMTLFVPITAIVLQGPPTAIARMISESKAVNDLTMMSAIFQTSRKLMLAIGLLTSVMMLLLAPIFINFIWTDAVLYPFMMLTLAPLFLAVIAAYTGYYQGLQQMSAIAYQQLSDAIVRVVVGLGLAYVLLGKSQLLSTTGAVFGTTAGSIAGLIAIMIYHHNQLEKPFKVDIQKSESIKISKEILKISLPITIGAVGASLVALVDAILLNLRLSSIGYSESYIYSLNGVLSNVNAIVNVPLIIGVAISLNIVPNIASARIVAIETVKSRMRSSMILSLSLAVPCGVGLFIVGKDIFQILYPSMSMNHYLVELFSISIIFVMINQSFIAILQGMSFEKLPVRNFYIGMVVKIIASYVLLGMSSINIHGAPISTLICYLIITVLNFYSCKSKAGFRIDFKFMVLLPILNVALMGGSVWATKKYLGIYLSTSITLAISILVGVIIYGILLIVTKIVSINHIPLLNKMVSKK